MLQELNERESMRDTDLVKARLGYTGTMMHTLT